MKISQIFFLLVWLLCKSTNFTAQNETKIWYFGNKAGLDFNTNPPTVLTNGVMNTLEGCATISNELGQLLFYSDGSTVWDMNGNVMANGSGLFGGQGSSTQACLIIKKPCSTKEYYIFTNSGLINPNSGLYYSVVDMGLSAGNGSVTVKNATLMSISTEKLCSVKHSNGIDSWIVCHEWNTNNFRSYLLTSSGVSSNATITSIGAIYNANNNNVGAGCMKISPDGKKLGVAIENYGSNTITASSFELFDFNNSIGQLNNLVALGSSTSAYGCEFSGDNSKFYGTDLQNLYQWNLTSTSIASSKQTVGTSSTFLGSMQLAPNGKIYLARINGNFLGLINAPNQLGTNANFVDIGQSVFINSSYGLPNFPSNNFWSYPVLSILPSKNFSMCIGESRTIVALGANTYTWNGTALGSSLIISPTTTSVYSVTGANSAGCEFTEQVTVNVNQCLSIEMEKKQKGIVVYPNPAQNTLKLNLGSGDDVSIAGEAIKFSITNIYGQVVIAPMLYQELLPMEIDVSSLSSGYYYLKLEAENHLYIAPFIIIK